MLVDPIAHSGRESDAQLGIAFAASDWSVARTPPPTQVTAIAVSPSPHNSLGPASEPGDDTLTPTAPVVRDNLGDPVPITTAELDAVETYLDEVLRDLFAPVTAACKRES
jgi:hypothetical protein